MPLQIQNAEKFTSSIEAIVSSLHLSYLDAIVKFCDDHDLEPEAVKEFINPRMREQLATEGRALNLLKRTVSLLD